jgi:hypothetical protein
MKWNNCICEWNLINRKFMEISCDQHLPWRSRRQYCLRLKSAYSRDSSLWTKENMLGSNNSCEYIARRGRVVLKSLRDLVRILLASCFSQRNQQRYGLYIIFFITMDWLLILLSIPSFVGRRVKTFFHSQVVMTVTGSTVHCDHSRYNNKTPKTSSCNSRKLRFYYCLRHYAAFWMHESFRFASHFPFPMNFLAAHDVNPSQFPVNLTVVSFRPILSLSEEKFWLEVDHDDFGTLFILVQ